MSCKICNSKVKEIFSAMILNKYNIKYYKCIECDFIQTEEAYWLEEAYSDAISISDTGVMSRNNNLSKTTSIILFLIGAKKESHLDYGGGYGIFTRLMRDKGFNFFWYDKYANNLVARGFEGQLDEQKYGLVTSFENFEHFENPLEDIEKIFSLSDTVLFSTELIATETPSPYEWWYYCLEHGQHISLFSKKSLEYIANKYGYYFISNNKNLHIFSKRKFSKNIFIVEKVLRKFGFSHFFNLKPKTNDDMYKMIQKMSSN